jgi:hypothetical protein
MRVKLLTNTCLFLEENKLLPTMKQRVHQVGSLPMFRNIAALIFLLPALSMTPNEMNFSTGEDLLRRESHC